MTIPGATSTSWTEVVDWRALAASPAARIPPADRKTADQLRAAMRQGIEAGPKLGHGIDMTQHAQLDGELRRLSAEVTPA